MEIIAQGCILSWFKQCFDRVMSFYWTQEINVIKITEHEIDMSQWYSAFDFNETQIKKCTWN